MRRLALLALLLPLTACGGSEEAESAPKETVTVTATPTPAAIQETPTDELLDDATTCSMVTGEIQGLYDLLQSGSFSMEDISDMAEMIDNLEWAGEMASPALRESIETVASEGAAFLDDAFDESAPARSLGDMSDATGVIVEHCLQAM